MTDRDFTDTKADTRHAPITNFVFNKRGVLFVVTGLIALAALYFELKGAALSGAQQSLITGIGAVFVIWGLVVRLWASMYIVHNRNRHLVSSGPYSIVRNPLYMGNFIAVFGAFFATGSVSGTVICMLGMAFVYYFTIKYEDARLAIHFEEEFTEFRNRVPSMLLLWSSFQALCAQEEPDRISYNSIQKELGRAMQAMVVIAVLLSFTYVVRYNLL